MLTIDYDQETQAAVIVADSGMPDLSWAEVRRVCEERSPHILSLGSKSLSIPWWSFLALRGDLRYVLRKHSVDPKYGENARDLLRRARARENAFESSPVLESVDIDGLHDRLEKVGFSRRLTPQQARNVLALIKYPAAATFSVPGSGKTTEALAYFFLRRQPDTKLLVVAPKNAFSVWEEQIGECLPGANYSIKRLQGGQARVAATLAQDPAVALITYEQLSRTARLIALALTTKPFFMYLDESHRMKRGFAGVYGSNVLSLAHLPTCKLILSGTPMPNAVADLVPQFTFLYPELRVDETNVVSHIQKVYVRTTKDELGLRNPVRVLLPVNMGRAQRRLYESLCSEAARQIEGLSSTDRIRLRAFGRYVVRLIQVATDPALLSQSDLSDHRLLRDAIAEGVGPKVHEACRIARKLAYEGKKCIIWSQFVQVVESIADMLVDLGAEFIHGGVEADEDEENLDSREAKIRRFHDDPSCMVLVANPAACAEGISLHKVCHQAIYVDRNYNAAQYLQSEDRIHRLGLHPDQNTYITLLHCPSTIDVSIQRRLEAKVNLMRGVLDDKTLNIEPLQMIDEESGLSDEDIGDIRRILLGE